MKIMIAMHTFNNFGGIIAHNEQLIAGLKELGHDVTFAYLKPTAQAPRPVNTTDLPEGYEFGAGTGLPVHQGKGWNSPYYSFKNPACIARFVEEANKHDILIWQSIFGFKNSETELFTDWKPMIEDVTAKQVVVIHDGNLKKLYSWIYKFSDKFAGLACVHPSAFKQAEFMPVPRNIILNPQNVDGRPVAPAFSQLGNQILSLQTFKRWKRVDDLVRAIPYINADKVIIAGDGIERNYMTSPDKCKEEYFCTFEYDPDASPDMLNKKIWDNALATNKFEYIGFITEAKRDEILSKTKFLIDTSWSNTYGEHFNRVVVDAIRAGVVPIARNLGVSEREDGVGMLLKPNLNYLMIRHDTTPKQFGEAVNNFLNISEVEYNRIRENNFKLLKKFDRKRIAQQYIDLAMGKAGGELPENMVGAMSADPKVQSVADKIWEEHFEPAKVSTLEDFFA